MCDESLPPASEPVVKIAELSRSFGSTRALAAIDLAIPKGGVFGLVGANGAGKTTLIKHVLGLLRPESGAVSVFGLDPIAHPTSVLSRIGYVSEVSELPDWMRVGELLRFTRAFYPDWDDAFAEQLRRVFELEERHAVKSLSKGQRARLALLLALAHRPQLLVLDEPSSGLDPLVRRDILRAIIKTIAEEGRTVLFSSHLLDEVERVADHVAILDRGRIIESDGLDAMKADFHRLTLHFDAALPSAPKADNFFDWQGGDRQWSAFFRGPSHRVEHDLARLDARLIERATPSLTEIFVALVGAARGREELEP
jgi:ABC-2 type transport system ATP-binding protein